LDPVVAEVPETDREMMEREMEAAVEELIKSSSELWKAAAREVNQ
jgi:hypothetical protein